MTDESQSIDGFLWLSLGENCLPDDILKRHSRKSFSTPYSSGRTNIDYAIFLESENYSELLSKENLVYGDAWGTKVVRSNYVTKSDDIYELGCSKGFEFTHHDPISSPKDLESCRRKIQRLLNLRGKRNVLFMYHHRRNARSDINKIKDKLRCFQSKYRSDGVECLVVLFYQSVVKKSERCVEFMGQSDGLFEFAFFTEHLWGGNDPNVMWALNDEDLIRQMIANIDGFLVGRKVQSLITSADRTHDDVET